jgi:hypothetical protein
MGSRRDRSDFAADAARKRLLSLVGPEGRRIPSFVLLFRTQHNGTSPRPSPPGEGDTYIARTLFQEKKDRETSFRGPGGRRISISYAAFPNAAQWHLTPALSSRRGRIVHRGADPASGEAG